MVGGCCQYSTIVAAYRYSQGVTRARRRMNVDAATNRDCAYAAASTELIDLVKDHRHTINARSSSDRADWVVVHGHAAIAHAVAVVARP